MTEAVPVVIPVGDNSTLFWGITTAERIRRLARAMKLPAGQAGDGAVPALLASCTHAFDPAWLRHFARHPGTALTLAGVPVIAHCRNATERAAAEAAMRDGTPLSSDVTLAPMPMEGGASILNEQLRKREQPFAMPLTPATLRAAERASYFGAYKGVTDILTKYLWPEWALVLTRIAARIGMTPNMVTAIGAILCVLATVAFWHGHFWSGMAMGLGFMVLDTVDGKLARCTVTSSKWGNVFDHGIDLVHPPFWWVAWGVGLIAYGRPLEPEVLQWTLAIILIGYVVQRLIEGAFMRLYGMHIHVWQKVDSDFRLITARRNPNMVLLFVATLVGRPDIGLIAVAVWTALSLVFHAVRLAQAMARVRLAPIRSWLEQA
ncbi:CDP-alcohol phosphatidyltransferase family protein [Sphingobium sp. AN641]|uniref:CDP-alcohol phosphatidyltransferase family protein n=1 Tax=Sphingobium sp. AN641 TaxID=3133443 RepID=UPI0030BF62FE